MFGFAFFRSFKYKIVTHARVFSLKPKFEISENQGLFLANSFHFMNKNFGYENMCLWTKIKEEKIQLPIKNEKNINKVTDVSEVNNVNKGLQPLVQNIDFDFMESFIEELEKEKIGKLNNYLEVTWLKNYTLTLEEEKVLVDFENGKFEWGEFKLGDLFEKINTNKLPFKANDLPAEQTNKYNLPCLTSSFKNQGLNYFVPKDNATILKNVISLPSNSDIYRAYFQSREFTILSDAYAINWIYNNDKLSSNQYLFTVPCINKVTDLSIYSYKNKLWGWNVVRNKYIELPTKNNQPDYKIIETLISAIQKMVIKDVVEYVEGKV